MKRAFLFQLFVILFVTIFCALGSWQLYRLQWKLELISEIAFGLNSSPIEFSNSTNRNYQRVSVKGKFNFDQQIYLYSLNDNGKPGFDVVTPFRTNKNENVLINRGWINKELKGNPNINLEAESQKRITGLLPIAASCHRRCRELTGTLYSFETHVTGTKREVEGEEVEETWIWE